MTRSPLSIGVVTDEVSRSLPEALEIAQSWGLGRFELREGEAGRFPAFTRDEVAALEDARRQGGRITAVSPGIFKGSVEDEAATRAALEDTLPRTIELAHRLGCPLVIIFGFERHEGEPDASRTWAMRAFEAAADQAHGAGMRVAIENEPDFWIDRPEPSAGMLDEIGHPALALNWDPANLHWGGHRPTVADLEVVLPHLANLHVKDYAPGRPQAPWFPVGEGQTPWADLLPTVQSSSDLEHVTLETHCEPLVESSRRSLDALRTLLDEATVTP
ncbi:sugar phosphate isomerase/epimerase family protein [Rubrivirga sp.]|uniref:sugar phosphate isomerase/epimerase family protein n=1 Tax=Rubrivirga sp. TaxID=1885344 RepID=UPI003B52F460